MYENQTHSKNWRARMKIIDPVWKLDSVYHELEKKHFKRSYAGRPTKRYLKLLQQIDRMDNISIEDVMEALC